MYTHLTQSLFKLIIRLDSERLMWWSHKKTILFTGRSVSKIYVKNEVRIKKYRKLMFLDLKVIMYLYCHIQIFVEQRIHI